MTDRQDIDALLIGSLYGELSSTEEARLSAHLESHPADRAALANLQWARDTVRESRILQVQFEPPQSVSALLLQEAHRRAPKAPKDAAERSWFQRFMRSFMLHPAVAAAAMLVLVVGIAGTMYMRGGDQYAKQTADDRVAPELADKVAAPSATGPAQEQSNATGSAPVGSDEFRVQLDDERAKNREDGEKRDEQDAPAVADTTVDSKSERQLGMTDSRRRDRAAPSKPETVAKKPSKGYLEVTTPDRAPKDFDTNAKKSKTVASRGDTVDDVAGAPSTTTVAGSSGVTGGAQPRQPAVAAEPAPAPAEGKAAPPPAAPPQDPAVAWAKQQHGKVIAQVKAGNCSAAATLALQIANRAPSYYAAYVEDDIAIKNCKAYITQQREKEAERVQRAKATQQRRTEPAR